MSSTADQAERPHCARMRPKAKHSLKESHVRERETWRNEISRLTERNKGRKRSVGLVGEGVWNAADNRGLRKEQLALGPQRVPRAQGKRDLNKEMCMW